MSSSRVELHLYDVSNGFAEHLAPAALGMEIEGLWHSGIVVNGVEYHYGPGGLWRSFPQQNFLGTPTRVTVLGQTSLAGDDLEDAVRGLVRSRYNEEQYDMLFNNGNHFANDLSLILTGSPLPDYVLNQVQDILTTPIGERLVYMLPPFLFSRNHRPSRATPAADPAAASTSRGPFAAAPNTTSDTVTDDPQDACPKAGGRQANEDPQAEYRQYQAEYLDVFQMVQDVLQNLLMGWRGAASGYGSSVDRKDACGPPGFRPNHGPKPPVSMGFGYWGGRGRGGSGMRGRGCGPWGGRGCSGMEGDFYGYDWEGEEVQAAPTAAVAGSAAGLFAKPPVGMGFGYGGGRGRGGSGVRGRGCGPWGGRGCSGMEGDFYGYDWEREEVQAAPTAAVVGNAAGLFAKPPVGMRFGYGGGRGRGGSGVRGRGCGPWGGRGCSGVEGDFYGYDCEREEAPAAPAAAVAGDAAGPSTSAPKRQALSAPAPSAPQSQEPHPSAPQQPANTPAVIQAPVVPLVPAAEAEAAASVAADLARTSVAGGAGEAQAALHGAGGQEGGESEAGASQWDVLNVEEVAGARKIE